MANVFEAQQHLSRALIREPLKAFYDDLEYPIYPGDPWHPLYARWYWGFPIVHGVGIHQRKSGEEGLIILTAWQLGPHLKGSLRGFVLKEVGLNPHVEYAGIAIPATRPALGGDSVSVAKCNPTGTIGCHVRDSSGKALFLSCNHVLADSYGIVSQSSQVGLTAADIWQPGHGDNGTSSDKIGTLFKAERLNFNLGVNYMDAAIAEVTNATDIDSGVRVLGGIKGIDASPSFNIRVRKNGWSTQQTQGKLRIKSLSVLINYSHGTAQFDDQYAVMGTGTNLSGQHQPNFAQTGDSGSIVIDDNDKAIGMVFAVASGTDLAYVNPIEPILNKLSVNIA